MAEPKKRTRTRTPKIVESSVEPVNEPKEPEVPEKGGAIEMDKKGCGLVACGIGGLFLLILTFMLIQWTNIKGNQMGVKETWMGGVQAEPLQPGTHFLFPGFSQKVYVYDMSSKVFTMNDNPSKGEPAYEGREADSYNVQSVEGQNLKISLNLRWHIDPDKLVALHKSVRDHLEEKLIRPTVMLIIKNEATRLEAIKAFSGEGLVKLQLDVHKDLTNPAGELASRGIVVENFVIEKIELDHDYIAQIRAKQVATQAKLRADEEAKAANAMALKVQAEAKADYNKRVVEAERDKQVGILAAEQDKQKQILAAQANAEKVTLAAQADKQQAVLAAEGEKEAGFNRAAAIEAVGKAEAEATRLKLNAYSAPGADAFVKVEIAKQMAVAYGGIKGYLPADMKVSLLTDNFMDSVRSLMGSKVAAPVPQK